MAVRFNKVIQRAGVGPIETGPQDFNLSEPVPAGLVEMIGLRMKYTSAAASHAANEWGLLKTCTVIYNGNQVFNYTDLSAVNTLTTLPRNIALVEDLGGYIQSTGSSTSVDSWMWIPLGINLGGNSRVEVRLNFVTATGGGVTNREFEIWHKYGSSSAATIVGNATTAAMSGGSQTQVTVKIPSYPNATVTAIQLQSTTAGDDVSGVIVKPVSDFEFTADALRANAGRGFGGELYDYLDGATLVQTDGAGSGQVLLPCYGYSSADNSIVLLVTATTSENYSFTPILSVPTSGNGERMGTQTASKATSGADAVLDRAE